MPQRALAAGRRSPAIRPMPAARRLTEPRTRTTAMTPNASVAGGQEHQHASISGELLPIVRAACRAASIGQILKLTMRYMMKLPISIQPPAQPRHHLGQVLVPDAGVEVRRDDLDDQEHRDRQRRQDHRRGAAFGRQRADLAPHLEALADDGGQVFQDFAEIAAGRALDRHRGDEQRQVVLADAEIQIAHARFRDRRRR